MIEPPVAPSPDMDDYRKSLSRYQTAILRRVCDAIGLTSRSVQRAKLPELIEAHLANPDRRNEVIRGLRDAQAIGALSVLTEVPWRLPGVCALIQALGYANAERTVWAWIQLGLVAIRTRGAPNRVGHILAAAGGSWWDDRAEVIVHPAFRREPAGAICRTPTSPVVEEVSDIRETDGLDLPLRLAALWQRVRHGRIRVKQGGGLFKRELDRLNEDIVLTCPAVDGTTSITNIATKLLDVARRLDLIDVDPEWHQLRAKPSEFWRLPLHEGIRRLLSIWIDLGSCAGITFQASERDSALRWSCLFALAALAPDKWVSLDALSAELDRRSHPSHAATPGLIPVQSTRGSNEQHLRWKLGLYLLGVVRFAQSVRDGAEVVQLTPLGRWLGHVGHAPPESVGAKNLVVQPNHEIVVYRSGLAPSLIGELATFCVWKGISSAVTLELTAESVCQALECGRNPDDILGLLERHGQRTTPATVSHSIRSWSSRQEKIRIWMRGSILEFLSADELDAALQRGVSGLRVAERLLLVADERQVPFERLRLVGSRDYRSSPPICIDVEPDDVTLRLRREHADLLVEREIAQLADPIIGESPEQVDRYRVTPQSLARAMQLGRDLDYLRRWFIQRVRMPITPSIQLMLMGVMKQPLVCSKVHIIGVPHEAIAEGLLKHPATARLVTRFGPKIVGIKQADLAAFHAAVKGLGISLVANAEPEWPDNGSAPKPTPSKHVF